MVLVPKFWSGFDLGGISLHLSGKGKWTRSWGEDPQPDRVVGAEQVHGDQVAVVDEGNLGKVAAGCDGLLTLKPNLWLGVRVADCLPLFLLSNEGKMVGIAHLGWRGLLKELVPHFVRTALSLGDFSPQDLLFIIGPSIGPCCYQVGEELAQKFQLKFGNRPGLVMRMTPQASHPYLDLRFACLLALEAAGINHEQVWAPITCTACQPQFYSYRSSGGKLEGGNWCLIGLTR